VHRFRNYIHNCIADYHRREDPANKQDAKAKMQNYYSPYVALVQSSGFGKSRLLQELAETDYLVYVSFRHPKAAGHPPRTEPLASSLLSQYSGQFLDDSESLHSWKCFLFSVIDEIVRENGRCFPYRSMETYELHHYTKEELKQNIESLKGSMEAGNDLFKSGRAILFALDEARALLEQKTLNDSDAFRTFRRAMKFIADEFKMIKIFGILTDTSSRVANFAPEYTKDTSARTFGAALFRPYFCLATADVVSFVKPSTEPDFYKNVSQRNREANTRIEILCKGRPLWASYANTMFDGKMGENTIEQSLVLLALNKLVYPEHFENVEKMNFTITEVQKLAVLTCRLGLEISHLAKETSELVSSHMATLINISDDRTTLSVLYGPEPSLAVAAGLVMRHFGPELFIDKMYQLVANGLVESGSRGELVARFLLIHAWDKAIHSSTQSSKISYSIPTITVLEFLKALFGKRISLDFLPEEVRMGLVSFTQFVRTFYTPDQATLKEALKHSVALIMKPNAPGADLIIPVVLRRGVSFIAVQVKNRGKRTSGYRAGVADKLSPHTLFEDTDLKTHSLPYLGLYLNLGCDGSKIDYPTWSTQTPDDLRLALFGMEKSMYPLLSGEHIRKLKDVLNAYPINQCDCIREKIPQVKFFIPESDVSSELSTPTTKKARLRSNVKR